jgi:hypothetical protein
MQHFGRSLERALRSISDLRDQIVIFKANNPAFKFLWVDVTCGWDLWSTTQFRFNVITSTGMQELLLF